jgi:hypothetical protein
MRVAGILFSGENGSGRMGHFNFTTSALRFVTIAATATAFACAGAEISSSSGLSVRVDDKSGNYELTAMRPAWKFSGSIGTSLDDVSTNSGSDALGGYEQIQFKWQRDGKPMTGWVRLHEASGAALFSQTCVEAMAAPPAPFPAFTNLPDLHVFSYGQKTFSPPHFEASQSGGPWLLFDDQTNAAIISPANHFMVASMSGDGHTLVASGGNTNLQNLPAGYAQETLMVLDGGINHTWYEWGHALLALEGAKRPANDADATLKYLGYWTDNGAGYYYNYDADKGYAGTMQALVERYRAEQFPIRYLQLDSWWYYKTTTDANGKAGKPKKSEKLPEGEWNRYGGLLEYKAHPFVFPEGLAAFDKKIGLPLVTHNRWIDPTSPYVQHYKISGVAAVDPKWWDDIASYLKESGIATYEQDWLDRIYIYSPAFSREAGVGEAFLDNMSRACRERGITMQYCMPLPCHFLQGSRYSNLTTIRTSGDRFNKDRWNDFLYTSRMASALGIWPWTDVFMSTERDNVLLATLSAGPVGIGDLMGHETKTNIFQSVRADGVIVKPDAPMVPMDASYLADAKKEAGPLLASTFTEHDGVRTEYVFAWNRPGKPAGNVHLNLAEFGARGPAYVYDYFSGSAKRVEAGADFSALLAENATAFYVIAPVGKSGIAFLGDADKFVGTGRQRIDLLRDEPGKLGVGVLFAQNENSVTLHGFAASAPKAVVTGGTAGEVHYDKATGHFTVEVKVAAEKALDTYASDPVRRETVVLETK